MSDNKKKYDFKYLPLSGPLPGREFKQQTEKVINELGDLSYDSKSLAEQASSDASEAGKIAYQAQKTADEAKTNVGIVNDRIDSVNVAVNNIEQNLDIVDGVISNLKMEVENFQDIAVSAENQANDNTKAVAMIKETLSEHSNNLLNIDNKATVAMELSTINEEKINIISLYRHVTEITDLNEHIEFARLYIQNTQSNNIPVQEIGLLDVDIANIDFDKVIVDIFDELVMQKYLSLVNYKLYFRQGKLSYVHDEDNKSFTIDWSDWELPSIAYELKENKNAPSGYAGLDTNGKLPESLLPIHFGNSCIGGISYGEPWISKEIAITETQLGSTISIEHGLAIDNLEKCICDVFAVCQSSEFGWPEGSIICQLLSASADGVHIPLKPQLDLTHVTMRIGKNGIFTVDETGNNGILSLDCWLFKVRIWQPKKINHDSGITAKEIVSYAKMWTSAPIAFGEDDILISVEHGLNLDLAKPYIAVLAVKNISTLSQYGYEPGEECTQVTAFDDNYLTTQMNPRLFANSIETTLGAGYNNKNYKLGIVNKRTGSAVELSKADYSNWAFIFKIVYFQDKEIGMLSNGGEFSTQVKVWESEELQVNTQTEIMIPHSIENLDVDTAIASIYLVCKDASNGFKPGDTITQFLPADASNASTLPAVKIDSSNVSFTGGYFCCAMGKDGIGFFPTSPAFVYKIKVTYFVKGHNVEGGNIIFDNDGKISASQLPTLALDNVPIGTIIMSLSNTVPDGYLELKGDIVSRDTYPTLWKYANESGNIITEERWLDLKNTNTSIGHFSTGDESSNFRLPMLNDYPRGLGDSGRNLGEYQSDAIRNIQGSMNLIGGGNSGFYGSSSGALSAGNRGTRAFFSGANSDSTNASIILNAANAVPTADENRPKTIVFKFLIKAYGAVFNTNGIDIGQLSENANDHTSRLDVQARADAKTLSGNTLEQIEQRNYLVENTEIIITGDLDSITPIGLYNKIISTINMDNAPNVDAQYFVVGTRFSNAKYRQELIPVTANMPVYVRYKIGEKWSDWQHYVYSATFGTAGNALSWKSIKEAGYYNKLMSYENPDGPANMQDLYMCYNEIFYNEAGVLQSLIQRALPKQAGLPSYQRNYSESGRDEWWDGWTEWIQEPYTDSEGKFTFSNGWKMWFA